MNTTPEHHTTAEIDAEHIAAQTARIMQNIETIHQLIEHLNKPINDTDSHFEAWLQTLTQPNH